MKWLGTFSIALILIGIPLSFASAQVTSQTTTTKAKVTQIIKQGTETVGDATIPTQTVMAEILDGPEQGKSIVLDNDYPTQLRVGQVFYATRTDDPANDETTYQFLDPDRLPGMAVFVGILLLLIFIFGGKQGIRGLLSLIGSIVFIVYVLLPGVLHGFSPILMSTIVAALIVVAGSYITHGVSKTTTSAILGMILTIIISGILAFIAIHYVYLSGFSTDEANYLNVNGKVHIDFTGLLLGGILIGFLGILYDGAIGQAVAVDELQQVGPHLSRRMIYRRAIRIGREHIGALMNTLAIAYVGASLPLLLLFYDTSYVSPLLVMNKELFATEIIRIVIGSIGLILTVPITTLIATLMLVKEIGGAKEIILEEEKKLSEYGHHH